MDYSQIERIENGSETLVFDLKHCKIQIGKLSKVLNSKILGPGQIDDFSCINRSTLDMGFGIGVQSYVSDTRVGNFTLIGSRVSIGGFEHPTNWLSVGAFQWGQSVEHWGVDGVDLKIHRKPEHKITTIGCDVWIGNNAVVKSGVSIGNGAVIGAGSVVTKDVKEFEVVAGNPAKFLKFRYSKEIINKLIAVEWWNLPFTVISKLDFENPLEAIKAIERWKQATT